MHLKGESVVVVFRSFPLNLELCNAKYRFSDTYVRSAVFVKLGGKVSTPFSFISDRVW